MARPGIRTGSDSWLWIAYALLFLGELRAWWIPYLLRPASPSTVARYETLFGRTHSPLPRRNGIAPNTLHTVLHLATLITLVLLALL